VAVVEVAPVTVYKPAKTPHRGYTGSLSFMTWGNRTGAARLAPSMTRPNPQAFIRRMRDE